MDGKIVSRQTPNTSSNKSDKTRTYLINGDVIKFHTVFKDGSEIVEEFNLYSEEIISRRIKKLKMTGKEEWVIEIGDTSLTNRKDDEFLIRENQNNPILIRKDTIKEFQWRVRNLNYPKENFFVEIDKPKQELIIKTLNKKYYKRFDIPDLKRSNLSLDEHLLKVNFMNNTLVITPKEVIQQEEEILSEIRRIKKEIKQNPNAKYDPGCKNQ